MNVTSSAHLDLTIQAFFSSAACSVSDLPLLAYLVCQRTGRLTYCYQWVFPALEARRLFELAVGYRLPPDEAMDSVAVLLRRHRRSLAEERLRPGLRLAGKERSLQVEPEH